MKKTEEQKFLAVKEKLDYHRLPTVFPIEATDLLQRVLALVPKNNRNDKENIYGKCNVPSNELNDAVRLQISKVVKQNNRLHSELMNSSEEIQALKYNIEKHQLSKIGSRKQSDILVEVSRKRQEQLFQELRQVKFKYNQLMDLIHEDPNIQKQYLKRLIKHKKLEHNQAQLSPMIVNNNSESRKIGQHEINSTLQHKVQVLQDKISNRQAQIIRLQKKVEYDGLNMNKILKDFQNDRTTKKINLLEENIKYLEQQNKKMKQQVRKNRKQGGLKEALRQQTRKNHQTISQISSDNKSLKRKLKQKQFQQTATSKQQQRQIKKVKQSYYKIQSDYQLAQLTIQDLQKRCEFLQKQLKSVKKQLLSEQNDKTNKQILIDQMRNSQQGGKILSQYEIQDLKKKLQQTQILLSQYEAKIAKLLKQNQYYEEEGLIKSQAIQNLQKIVDQLMKRQGISKTKSELIQESLNTTNIDQAIHLKKQLTQIRHQLNLAKSDKMRLQQDLQNINIRYDQKVRENASFSEQINKMKNKIYEIKRLQNDQYDTDKSLVDALRLDLKKQQNLRSKIEAMHQEAQTQIVYLRRQFKELEQNTDANQRRLKNHIQQLTTKKAQLSEQIHIMQIRIKDRDKKISLYEEKLQELQNKITILRDEVNLLEDQKHSLMREKNRIQKHYEEAIRQRQQANNEDLQFMAINEHEATRFKKQVVHLTEKISTIEQENHNLRIQNEKLTNQKQVILTDKVALLRENDTLKRQCNDLQRRIISTSEK